MVKIVPSPKKFWQINRRLNYGREHMEKFFQKSMPFNSALDLGAGSGNDLLSAKLVNKKTTLYAIECYKPNVEILKRNQINVFNINIEKEVIPLPNESIDLIMTNQLLEHTKEIFWIFHEISRVLQPGGKLIIGVPNLASLHNRTLLSLGIQPTSVKTRSAHVRGFTKNDMLDFLNSCFPKGYTLKGFYGGNFYPFPATLARVFAKILPNMAVSIFLLFEKSKNYQSEFIEYPIKENLETPFYIGK